MKNAHNHLCPKFPTEKGPGESQRSANPNKNLGIIPSAMKDFLIPLNLGAKDSGSNLIHPNYLTEKPPLDLED